jgi:hypothetical protein
MDILIKGKPQQRRKLATNEAEQYVRNERGEVNERAIN